jgi:hypothetical protein
MKRPKSIRVGPFDVAIVPMHEIHAETDRGNYAHDKHEIRLLDRYASSTSEAEVLLHEILHSIWATYNVKDEDKEERVVTTIAIGLAQVLRDNKDLAEWLRAALK